MSNYPLTTSADNITGTPSADTFSGPGGGVDSLDGGAGNDEFDIDSNQAGTIDGGADTDTVKILDNQFGNVAFSNVEILRLESNNLYASVAQLNAFSSIIPDANPTNLYLFLQGPGGTINLAPKVDASVTLQVEAEFCTSAVTIYANASDSFLIGSDFNDKLVGGIGSDTLNGGGGNDFIYGGLGDDQLDGAAGINTAAFSTVARAVSVNLEAGTATGQGTDTLQNFQNATGSIKNDKLVGDAGNNTLQGLAGNDTLIGSKGADRLFGGAGADIFLYKGVKDSTVAASGRDTIFDFSAADGDKIDLSAIDANILGSAPGDQAFLFQGTAAFDGHAGELNYSVANGNAYVAGDVNGDGKADFSIVVAHTTTLAPGSFKF